MRELSLIDLFVGLAGYEAGWWYISRAEAKMFAGVAAEYAKSKGKPLLVVGADLEGAERNDNPALLQGIEDGKFGAAYVAKFPEKFSVEEMLRQVVRVADKTWVPVHSGMPVPFFTQAMRWIVVSTVTQTDDDGKETRSLDVVSAYGRPRALGAAEEGRSALLGHLVTGAAITLGSMVTRQLAGILINPSGIHRGAMGRGAGSIPLVGATNYAPPVLGQSGHSTVVYPKGDERIEKIGRGK